MKDTTVYILATLVVIAAISYAIAVVPAEAQMHPGLRYHPYPHNVPPENNNTKNMAHVAQVNDGCSSMLER